uniref:hypothetical protein n=1 Tax=Altererythrobacter segetis TaxID=1104773 RepID=UPI0014096538|nr:hypothetical protein [Altererythrobacter segetis]
MTMHFSDIARQAAADGAITPDEILALRRDGWGDGRITPDEADAIFAINGVLAERSPEWCDFFVEAIGEYVLNAWEPKGYVTDAQAAWLIGKIGADGKVDSMVELEVLLRLLERAANVPDSLKAYALEQIERAVMNGTGPTRDGGSLSDACVSEAECRALRRAIFAVGGDRPAAVSRREAEMLFRIKDATLGAPNAPEWKRLFVQGVGNYLMGYASPDAQLSRDRAAELEAFMADSSSSIGRFMARMARGAPNGFGMVFGHKAVAPGREQQVAEAQDVTGEECAWLDAQVHANGEVDEYDRALLAFIAEETGGK